MLAKSAASAAVASPPIRRAVRARAQAARSPATLHAPLRAAISRSRQVCRAQPEDDLFVPSNLEDLQKDIDVYLKQKNQADAEAVETEQIVGDDVVSDEDAREYCQRVVKVLKVLRERRRMSLSEIQLTIEIEQPEEIERNRVLGIQNVPSRYERALALSRVTEGKIPENRLALKLLCEELESWPFLDEAVEAPPTDSSQYERISGAQGGVSAPRKRMGRDPSDPKTSATDMLPDWIGYSMLYGVSAVPVIITISVIAILFFSSLK
eukprot:jgi/Tetstr1/428213/TSEL_018254.t1